MSASTKPAQSLASQNPPAQTTSATPASIFSIPAPVKKVFDTFPLKTYPANALPIRARRKSGNVLHIWKEADSHPTEFEGSCNPSCLKWEAYLKFLGVEFTTVASNNHASPSGSLPFLITEKLEADGSAEVIPQKKLREWALKDSMDMSVHEKEMDDSAIDAKTSLLDFRIRRAWNYTLHHTPFFHTLTTSIYITPTSNSQLIRSSLSASLLTAATDALQQHTQVISEADIFADAEEALDALESFLGNDTWFSGSHKPGWLDACVFAYTGLLGRDDGVWEGLGSSRLGKMYRARRKLVEHRRRIVEGWLARRA